MTKYRQVLKLWRDVGFGFTEFCWICMLYLFYSIKHGTLDFRGCPDNACNGWRCMKCGEVFRHSPYCEEV